MGDNDESPSQPTPIFQDISAEQSAVEIESLCMQCYEQGISRFLLTRIPHFRDIVISAFECPHCGFRNNGIQSASAIAEKGARHSCMVSSPEDLNRQVVVSEHTTVIIEELSLEIPPNREKGYLNTIEGIVQRISEDLSAGQEQRKEADAEACTKIQEVIEKLNSFSAGQSKFTFVLDDPSGNSYIENLCAPRPDPKLKTLSYRQTAEQLREMGFRAEEEENLQPESVYSFATNCSSCSSPCETRMHMVEIPHFREVIIMATTCDYCGYKTNEIKSGGAISEFGKRITLSIASEEDLNRDILKSETCTLEIPEIDLHLTTNSLGGRFTTLEGLLRQVHDELNDKVPFVAGDSAAPEKKQAFQDLLQNINKICAMQLPCRVILDDPLGNSYLQNIYAPDDDPNMTIEHYERTFEQNEDFGLNDIKVENYQEDGGQTNNNS